MKVQRILPNNPNKPFVGSEIDRWSWGGSSGGAGEPAGSAAAAP
jgi:hypothetical protein